MRGSAMRAASVGGSGAGLSSVPFTGRTTLVSGITKNAATRSTSARAAATSGGNDGPILLAHAPMTGPRTMPRPIPAPSRPMPFARSFPRVTSAIAAWQAAMFPAVAPARIRETKRSGRKRTSVAKAKRTIDAALPASDRRITRRRPNRSEMRPRIGVATSWVNENEPNRKPTVSGVPPIDFT